jgi:acyl carrier protein
MDDTRTRAGGSLLAAVRAALMSHPEVREAEAASMPELTARPVAVVVTSGFVGAPELRRHVRARLGQDGAPDMVAILPELPRTPERELDLAELRDQLAAMPSVYRFLPPRSDLERWLAEVWSALLTQPEIGIRDDFLELGGDSLSATSVLAEMHSVYGVDVSLADFFELATIERLAAVINSHHPQDGPDQPQARRP